MSSSSSSSSSQESPDSFYLRLCREKKSYREDIFLLKYSDAFHANGILKDKIGISVDRLVDPIHLGQRAILLNNMRQLAQACAAGRNSDCETYCRLAVKVSHAAIAELNLQLRVIDDPISPICVPKDGVDYEIGPRNDFHCLIVGFPTPAATGVGSKLFTADYSRVVENINNKFKEQGSLCTIFEYRDKVERKVVKWDWTGKK